MVFRDSGPREAAESDAAGGPAEDFAEQVLAQIDRLYGTAFRLTRDRGRAEDLVQETYLKALRSRKQFTAGTNLKAWLFTILHNTYRNTARGDRRDPVDVDSGVVEAAGSISAGPNPEEALLEATLDHDLRAALDALPAPFREAVWLRDVEELSYREMAGILDVPVGTVMSRISRGRRLLYERLSGRARAGGRP